MEEPTDPVAVPTDECTTTGSFADHEIDDGSVLIERTYYRLAETETSPDDPDSFLDALESAFIWAYLETTDGSVIPADVEAAIDDARAFARGEIAERPAADVRTDLVPTFYQYAAGFHCAYRADGTE